MERYWYFLIPAILICLIPSEAINETTKKWIPNEKKRAKCFMGILICMAVYFTVLLFFVTENIPLGFRWTMCLFPITSVAIGFLIGKFLNKKK